jgi:hypothetical protein
MAVAYSGSYLQWLTHDPEGTYYGIEVCDEEADVDRGTAHRPSTMSRSTELARFASLLARQSFACQSNGAVAVAQQQRFYANSKDGKVLHPDLLNDAVLKTQYAVRGELYLRAEELRKAGKEIIFTNGKSCVPPDLICS